MIGQQRKQLFYSHTYSNIALIAALLANPYYCYFLPNSSGEDTNRGEGWRSHLLDWT